VKITEKQAQDFLSQTDTKLEVVVIGKLIPEWDSDNDSAKPVKTLSVTLSNKRHTYNFKFYCSLYDTYGPERTRNVSMWEQHRIETKHKRTMAKKNYTYDILACLNIDHSEDFEHL
jgi:hypothetical protein